MKRARILIFRPDNIGDVVLFSGALRHIRALFPEAYLTLAVQAQIINLVELCPYVDGSVAVNRLVWWDRIADAGIPYAHRFEGFVRKMNRAWNRLFGRFDTIIYPVKSPQVKHLQVLRDLNVERVVGITGCRVNEPRAGYPVDLRPGKLFTDRFDVSPDEPWQHELLTTVDFLGYLGCRHLGPDDIQPEFWLSDNEKNLLVDVKKDNAKIIGIFPGASSRLRSWDLKNYEEFSRLLGGRYCYVVFGSLAEKELTGRVASLLREGNNGAVVVDLAGQTTLRELARGISGCDLFIGMDTSGLHLAIVAGVPTIGIIGGGHYGRFVPWGDKAKNIFLCRELACFWCNWLCVQERAECIQGVTPLEVVNAGKKLLE
ncbi:MAG: hypothetical protein OEY01_16125 [Desulfobulbaceae bacterium]|nr:hypothetical protein [Desulfobulbaceae bacterium]